MKLRVGISACLLGEEVRYDGGHKHHITITQTLSPHVEWVSVCPEVELGLGTPRSPIELRLVAGEIALVCQASEADLTSQMVACAQRRCEELERLKLSGYIFKARSPSCGLVSVRWDAPGLFAGFLRRRWPQMPMVEETALMTVQDCEAFLERVRNYGSRFPTP